MRFFLFALLLAGTQDSAITLTGKVTVAEGAVAKIPFIRYTGPDVKLLKPPDPSPAVVWLIGAPAKKTDPQTIEIRQQGLEYRPRVAAGTVGSTVKFPNDDDTQHNCFSLSPGKDFDVGKIPGGKSGEWTFEAKGRVDVRCKVHDHMRAYVHLFDHPYFAVVKEDGGFAIASVPPGDYTLVAWKEGFKEIREKVQVKSGASVDLKFSRAPSLPADRTALAGCCAGR